MFLIAVFHEYKQKKDEQNDQKMASKIVKGKSILENRKLYNQLDSFLISY